MNRQSKSKQKTQPENYVFWSPTVPSTAVTKYSAGTKRDVQTNGMQQRPRSKHWYGYPTVISVLEIYTGEKTAFSFNFPGKTGYLPAEEWRQIFYSLPYTKANLNLVKNLNLKWKTLKLLKENVGKYFWIYAQTNS